MKKLTHILFNFCFLILFSGNSFAQDVWEKIDGNLFKLNYEALIEQLKQLSDSESLFVEFPNTEENLEAFEIEDHSILPPALAIKYPSIHAYKGKSIYNENLSVNFTLNSQNISATLIEGTTTWDLVNVKGTNNYLLLKTEEQSDARLVCGTKDENTDESYGLLQSAKTTQLNSSNTSAKTLIGDNTLRTLRIAITVTGEYSEYFINKFSLTNSSEETQKAAVLGAIVASVNNINAVFERDLGVRFELIENNDEIIYLNPNTDPYTTDTNSSTYSEETIVDGSDVISSIIGLNNIDIGHTLSFIGAGLASVEALCTSFKAQGVSGGSSPEGTSFDFTLFAHELGHQLGADHTQNYSCNRDGTLTSVEPGSGTTIMGYAGIECVGGDMIQSNSDEYFHYVSILQIKSHLQSSICGIENTELTNSNPIIEALPNYNIPTNTNFVLEANATDVDADELTYCWEQIDGEVAEVIPPVSTNIYGPLFRSNPPTTDPKRYFPQEYNTNTEWEVLPTVSREMNFSLTVRDGNPGGIATTSLTVNAIDTGEQFEITSPTSGLRLPQNSFQQVRWNVAGTNANGINTENVKIEISYDNGNTYESLFDSTPNDGSETFTVPNTTLSNNARIKISAIDNIYYAITEDTFIIGEQLDDDLSPLQNPLPKGEKLALQIARLQVPQYTVIIYDLRGGKVYESIRESASDELDLDKAGLGTGLYIVKIVVGTRIYTEKLLKL